MDIFNTAPTLDELLKALTIFRKYGNPDYPILCEHEELTVMIDADKVSTEDCESLEELGFNKNDFDTFSSFRFGSA